ncbi:MAG: hypothetical protein ACFB0D_20290 [Phormidesmis sp.]|mgnify:FL=1
MAITNPFRATAIFLIEIFYDQLWGFKPNIVRPVVAQKGAVRSLFWFARNSLKYASTLEQWGPLRTHLLTTSISAINGCPYSVFGQAFALQLTYLKQTGNLLPLTEREMMALCGQEEAQVLSTLEQSLSQTSLTSEILSLQRMSELRHNPTLATTEQDHQLIHLIQMFATLNTCGMRNNLPTDQAHASINKNRAMRDRYIALREAERAQPKAAQPAGVTVLNPADIAADF